TPPQRTATRKPRDAGEPLVTTDRGTLSGIVRLPGDAQRRMVACVVEGDVGRHGSGERVGDLPSLDEVRPRSARARGPPLEPDPGRPPVAHVSLEPWRWRRVVLARRGDRRAQV